MAHTRELDMSFGERDDDSSAAVVLPSRAPDPLEDSAVFIRSRETAAIDLAAPSTRRVVADVLRIVRLESVSFDLVADAAVAIVDAHPTRVAAQIADLRRRLRPDAAILVVVEGDSPMLVREAHKAGAFACVRTPLVAEELASVLTRVIDTQTTKSRLVDLTRRLDVETHLASIGRMSAGMAHEIASPLMTASASLSTIEEGTITGQVPSAEMIEALASLRGALDRLNGVLVLTRKLMRKDSVRTEALDLAAMVAEARRVVAGELGGVEVTIIGTSVRGRADRSMLGQILQNLLSNAAQAAKALSSPRVRLHTYVSGDRAVVSVRDNGPGIPSQLQERIFDPFYTTRRAQGGTGLGLALCRDYAARMGAELSFWSVAGRGACFRVSMPLA